MWNFCTALLVSWFLAIFILRPSPSKFICSVAHSISLSTFENSGTSTSFAIRLHYASPSSTYSLTKYFSAFECQYPSSDVP
jgi:hypothetical protein